MDYVVVSTSVCKYQYWQIKLLYWSIKKVNQYGKLIVLLSEDYGHRDENFKFELPEDVIIINQPDYAREWQINTNDWWGGIPNKYKSVEWLCNNNYFEDNDRLLFLDPDMIFINKVNLDVGDNEVIGQKFLHFSELENWKNIRSNEAIMYPFFLNFKTLKKISKDYTNFCEKIRRDSEFKKWEAEMFGLHYAFKVNNINCKLIEDLGTCIAWNESGRNIIGNILHYPNIINDKNGERYFFKQDYTVNPDKKFNLLLTSNKTDNLLITNITQERTDFVYYTKWNFENIFRHYNGDRGYLIFRPWPGGFNNIRMSLELAVCISYICNRTLVLPPKYSMYLLEGQSDMETFFDTSDLGVKTITFSNFCNKKNIEDKTESAEEKYKLIETISKVLDYDAVKNVLNFEKINPPSTFLKGRPFINANEYYTDDECIFLNGNLLGSPQLTLYSKFDVEIKKIMARYIHYKHEIFDIAWQYINFLGDKEYYSIHIRRNDFQYKDLFVSCEEIIENIKDIIPIGAKLYIATDHDDREYFRGLIDGQQVYFYDDIDKQLSFYKDFNPNWIPIIEQLICTRSIKFIGNDLSTLSSYIFRMRGYMNDIEDKNYYINTKKFEVKNQCTFTEENNFKGNWAREYKDNWDFTEKTIFVSIASYCDSQVIETIKSLQSEALNPDRVFIGLHMQDNDEEYFNILKRNIKNVRIKFTPKEKTLGVVWARNEIKKELYDNQDYFLQIDSHTRVKKNWDAILINQYNSIDEDKVIITTYPNHFDMPDIEKKYLEKAYNTPLKIKRFLSEHNENDNRFVAENLPSLLDYEIAQTKWAAAGFLFTKKDWLNEVKIPNDIIFNGEEDHLTFLSFLKGWNLRVPSEATVWHNYDFRIANTEIPYRKHNTTPIKIVDNSIKLINDFIFSEENNRTIFDLENYFNIELKKNLKFNLGFFGSHNASIALSYEGTILEVIELERLINVKNAAFFFWGHHDNVKELLVEIKNYFYKKYNALYFDNVVYNSVDKEMWKIFPAKNYEWLPHHQTHAYSGLYQSPYDEALIISFDGGSDEGFFQIFIGKKQNLLEKLYSGTNDYAISYMMPAHFIEEIKQENIYTGNLIYSGKLMGLAGYGNAIEEWVPKFVEFYKGNNTDNIQSAYDRFLQIFSFLGIKDDSTRLSGELAKNLAATNQYVFEKLFELEITPFLQKYSDLPIIICGGCGLNIINNTKLAKNRKVFVTPNPNDTGLAVGLLCSKIRPHKIVDTTYIGPEVWDKNNLSQIIYDRKMFFVDYKKLADEIINGKIIGIVRGRSEHGARALGNRSIICDATNGSMKDILNLKVKGREYYRPFAPVVRLEDVSKYFEWEEESRWMTFCPIVKSEWKDILKAITHIDGTARVQTVTREQNEFIYDLLTEIDKKTGIGVILNTSFNIAGKPILNTYRDALWVFDNKQMDGLVLENYYLQK